MAFGLTVIGASNVYLRSRSFIYPWNFRHFEVLLQLSLLSAPNNRTPPLAIDDLGLDHLPDVRSVLKKFKPHVLKINIILKT